jgi:hypothetical protein
MPRLSSSPSQKKGKKPNLNKQEARDVSISKDLPEDLSEDLPEAEVLPLKSASEENETVYPATINKLISICLLEAEDVRKELKGKIRHQYLKIFENYRNKLSKRDESIIKGALKYLYENSRVKSITEEEAEWMIGIYEIPVSQILSYTSKSVLESLAKKKALPYSGKKSDTLVSIIRDLTDESK